MPALDTYYRPGDKWHGMDRWECNECPFDAVDESQMQDHVRNVHLLPPSPMPDLTLQEKRDRFGNLVTDSGILVPAGAETSAPAAEPEPTATVGVADTAVAVDVVEPADPPKRKSSAKEGK